MRAVVTVPLGSPRRAATSGPGEVHLTSQGHPRTIFRRAITARNLLVAEVTAREIGRVNLMEALELVDLIAEKDPSRYGRAAARWLRRYLEENPRATIDEALLIAGALAALGGPAHEQARSMLKDMAATATSRRASHRVAS